jgi:hypothetical protein
MDRSIKNLMKRRRTLNEAGEGKPSTDLFLIFQLEI